MVFWKNPSVSQSPFFWFLAPLSLPFSAFSSRFIYLFSFFLKVINFSGEKGRVACFECMIFLFPFLPSRISSFILFFVDRYRFFEFIYPLHLFFGGRGFVCGFDWIGLGGGRGRERKKLGSKEEMGIGIVIGKLV